MPPLIQLIRPHQYIKNSFVLMGLLFSHQWSLSTTSQAFYVFMAFCAMASAVYVLNDIMDIDADRAHPIKKGRPLPSGTVSLIQAKILLGALVTSSVLIACAVSSWTVFFVSAYFGLNVLYSAKLKHVVILDVFIISAGFMLRILAGTTGLGIEPSQWLLLCGLMVTLFLGFSKRRAELLTIEASGASQSLTRRVLDDYSPAMLEQFIAVTAACTILSYGLYTVSPSTLALHGSQGLIYTLPFVVYGIFRYLFLLHHKAKGSDTAKDLITDHHMLVTAVCWVAATLWVLA